MTDTLYATPPAGGRIAYRVHGPDEAPAGEPETLLLIMGLGGSGAMWWRLLPHLTAHLRVIVFDNRGTGASSPATRPLTMDGLASDTVAVLDAVGVERAHVMGASMGGMIAQHVALDHRGRVRSLVLACTSARGSMGAPNPRLLAASLLRPLVSPVMTSRLLAPALYSPVTRAGARDRMIADFKRRSQDRLGVLTPWMQMAAIAGHDTRRRLHELAGLRTLVVHGSDDALVPVQHGRELARAIPGARLAEIPRAGHLLTTDAEDAVAAAVTAHLASARDSAAAPA